MPVEQALVSLLSALEERGYRFTAVTPATHARVIERPGHEEARDLRGIFGWNLPFRSDSLPPDLLALLERGDAVDEADGLLKSRYRVASLGERLFLHSAFPTEAEDAVFFGPDTYRFARFIAAEVPRAGVVSRLVDIGAGTGAGGLTAGALLPGARVTLTDINPAALRLASVNAKHAGLEVEQVEGSGLGPVNGAIDLIVANPPYIIDDEDRTYRDGGGLMGAQLSLDWALEGAERLSPGGRMLLYTGVAIVEGQDALREALAKRLPPLGCTLRYQEIDPDVFGEELERPAYRRVERIAAIGAVIERRR